MALVEVVDLGVPATALSRRRALQLAGTVAAGVAVWAVVPSLTRGGLPPARSLMTSFGDVTVLAVTRSVAPLAGGRPLRHGVWRDALTASVALRNRTRLPQLLPSGQFRARVLGGPAVTAYAASPHLLTVPPRSLAQISLTFLVPQGDEIPHLEFTEAGASDPLRLEVPTAHRAPRRAAPADDHSRGM